MESLDMGAASINPLEPQTAILGTWCSTYYLGGL